MAFDLAADIKTLISHVTQDIYLNDTPDDPDNLIGIFESGGYNPQRVMDQKKPAWENPTFQLMIRNTSAVTAKQWIESCKDALDGITNITINGHRYLSIFQQGDVLPLGKDGRNRISFSLNFRCSVTR